MTPEVVQAISGLGALGFAVIAVWALATGRVRVGSLVDKAMDIVVAFFEKQYAEMKEERDGWRTLALGTTPELKRLNDLLDTAVRLLVDRRDPPA
jgi:hypothetical protein